MARYRQPEPPRRSRLRIVGRIFLWIGVAVAVLAVSVVAGLYLWFHESVAAVSAHSPDAKAAQKFLEPPPPSHAAIALVLGYDHRAGEATSIALALGHGDAAACGSGDEDDLDDVVPP